MDAVDRGEFGIDDRAMELLQPEGTRSGAEARVSTLRLGPHHGLLHGEAAVRFGVAPGRERLRCPARDDVRSDARGDLPPMESCARQAEESRFGRDRAELTTKPSVPVKQC